MTRLSIKTKLYVVLSMLVLSFVAFNAGYYPGRVERQARAQSEANAQQVAQAVAVALAPMLAAQDVASLDKVLEGLQGVPSYSFCAIFDEGGGRLGASPGTPAWVAGEFPRLQGRSQARIRTDGLLMATAPILSRQAPPNRVGTLILGFKTTEMQSTVRETAQLGLWVGLAALILGVAAAIYFTNQYVHPVLQLTEAARRVAEGHLQDVPLEAHTRDELGDLSRSFEVMTDRLRISREEIARQNRLLEFRVQERTRQLMETIWELEEIRSNLENLVLERTQGLEQSRAELKAWAETLEEKVREKTGQLTELNADLLASLRKLQQVDATKDEFLANMSHELRTPLNAVIGFSGLLLQESPERIDDDVKQDLQIILQNGRSLLAMIDSILDLSKIEAGKLELELREMDPLPILESMRPLATALILDRPLRFSYEPPTWSVTTKGDLQRFRQILTNLIGNAIKFTERGEVTLSVDREDGMLRISIKDTGIGMSGEEIGRLFKPFQQVDGSITRRFGGTGLGLALSQRLIGLMAGRITVESAKGQGSLFLVELPLLQGEAV